MSNSSDNDGTGDAGKRILVIDDDELVRDTICNFLLASGYEVESAEDGDQGLKLLEANPPDLVVTDILMPGKEGMETIMEIRRGGNDVKIVAISGQNWHKDISYLDLAKQLGANATLPKPFSRTELLTVIEELLN